MKTFYESNAYRNAGDPVVRDAGVYYGLRIGARSHHAMLRVEYGGQEYVVQAGAVTPVTPAPGGDQLRVWPLSVTFYQRAAGQDYAESAWELEVLTDPCELAAAPAPRAPCIHREYVSGGIGTSHTCILPMQGRRVCRLYLAGGTSPVAIYGQMWGGHDGESDLTFEELRQFDALNSDANEKLEVELRASATLGGNNSCIQVGGSGDMEEPYDTLRVTIGNEADAYAGVVTAIIYGEVGR